MKYSKTRTDHGFALITVLLLTGLLTALLGAYFVVSKVELATTKYTRDSTTGFYAAEAGLNLRAEQIRAIFVGYNRPTGTSPSDTNPCEGSNMGSGDFACTTYQFGNHTVTSYVKEDGSNPYVLTIPPGEKYQNLNAQEYRYTTVAKATNLQGVTESMLELRFKSRLVPLFQFVAFYDKDLEILPGPVMNLNGPVHTNGDLYLNSDATLTVNGQITTAGDLYRGRKNDSTCRSNSVRVYDPTSATHLQPACPSRTLINNVVPFNGMIQYDVDTLVVPSPDILKPTTSSVYNTLADLRLALHLNGAGAVDTTYATTGVEVRDSDRSVNTTQTNALNGCAGTISGKSIGNSNTFYNNREDATIRMLDVNLQEVLNCLHSTNWFGTGKLISDSTEGGLVFHLTVEGPNSNVIPNNYGVRIRGASTLGSSIGGAPQIKGITIVSDQAAYTIGSFNSNTTTPGWKPSAIMADSINILSQNWLDANSTTWSARNAANATLNVAFLGGTDTTGNHEGTTGQGGAYNGGLENYPRFHENWTGRTVTYRGSFVSLGKPEHVDGPWFYGNPDYTAPNRNWDYDTRFNNAANLPPLTPRFVYLRQELFVRDFEQ